MNTLGVEENLHSITMSFSTWPAIDGRRELLAETTYLFVAGSTKSRAFSTLCTRKYWLVQWLKHALQLIFPTGTAHTCMPETRTDEVDFSVSNKRSVEVERDSEALAHKTMEVVLHFGQLLY